MAMAKRTAPAAPTARALTGCETRLPDQVRMPPPQYPEDTIVLTDDGETPGGCLARASGPPPGAVVMWRDLHRLRDIGTGASMPSILTSQAARCARTRKTFGTSWERSRH